MIEVYVPFVLIVMSWNTSDPAGTLDISQRLFIDQQTCMAAGRELDAMMATVEESEGSAFAWRCVEQVRDIEVFEPDTTGK